MNSTPAPERRFESKYALEPGTLVPAATWLAEFMTARQAAKEGVELPRGFWRTHPKWEKVLKQQLRSAASLLRLVPLEAVGAVLRGRQGRRVLSLAAPWLTDLVREEARKLELKKAAAAALEPEPPPPAPPPETNLPAGRRPALSKAGRGTLDKLEGL